ncbi:phospholipase D family protein [Aliarcobacter butzleri]|uniref:phospholipase D family protein n=1 Tax=Aliarcobacter butzleri TaxID=28197 RepID=UPI001261040B|nr:phospholipase D family protein [Aliarcobacter butzleri]
MQFISENKKINNELKESIIKFNKIYIAVAWARYSSNEISHELNKNKNKIQQLIVGIEKEITDPDFLLNFQNIIRIIKLKKGLFHPKVYLFTNENESKWNLFIGSANLTYSALHNNEESMILLTEKDSSIEIINDVKKQLNNYNSISTSIDKQFINTYTSIYNKRQKTLQQRTFFDRYTTSTLYDLSWNDYEQFVKSRYTNNISWYDERIKVIDKAQEYFDLGLENIDKEDFKAILGLKNHHKNLNWYNFGHMRQTMNIDDLYNCIKELIKIIDKKGPISQEKYYNFMQEIMKVKGVGISIATRFLALRRPDKFFCVTGQNIHRFEKDFKYIHKDIDSYWKMITKDFPKCKWYSDEKAEKDNSKLWQTRVAMLDTILYIE